VGAEEDVEHPHEAQHRVNDHHRIILDMRKASKGEKVNQRKQNQTKGEKKQTESTNKIAIILLANTIQ
jgi:hypothetical protein